MSAVMTRLSGGQFTTVKRPPGWSRRPADPISRQAQALSLWSLVADTIGPRYIRCALSNFDLHGSRAEKDRQHRVVKEVRQYATNIAENIDRGRNVVLYGTMGTGKDHLLVPLAKAACDELRQVKHIFRDRMFKAIRDDFKESGGVLNKFKTKPVLIISDILPPGETPLTDWEQRVLHDLLEHRTANYLPTWVSVNLSCQNTNQAAYRRMGPQSWDRLRGNGALMCACEWPSYRQV